MRCKTHNPNRNGLLFFSSPMVDGGPCPGYTTKLSGRYVNFFNDSCMSDSELSGKSVLPMEPQNNASPVNTSLAPINDMLPRLWPGVCTNF